MSEPTLYQIEYRKPNEPDTHVAVLPDGGLLVPVEPDAWGITEWRQLYDNMRVAETGGDWIECTDALGAALGIGDNDADI